MTLHSRLSRAAVDLVLRFETFHAQAQPAAGGGWTIGYGHTRSARPGVRIDRQDGETLLLYDLAAAAEAVEASLFAPVNQRQFDALTAFCFNIGAENFHSSTALARINAGAELQAADEIERWRRAELGAGPQVVDALVRRRVAEKAHFLGLPEGCSKTPRAVLRPLPGPDGEGREAFADGFAASATLDAANSVQARLRELVPEPEPPPFDEDAGSLQAQPTVSPIPPTAPEPVPTPSDAAAHELAAADLEPLGPSIVEAVPLTPNSDARPPLMEAEATEPAPYVAPPPPPPTRDAAVHAANDMIATDQAPPTAAQSIGAGEEPSVAGRPVARALRPRLTSRGVYAILAVLGACLFAVAAVFILSCGTTLCNLVLGVGSVGLMTPGVYGLLGPRPLKG